MLSRSKKTFFPRPNLLWETSNKVGFKDYNLMIIIPCRPKNNLCFILEPYMNLFTANYRLNFFEYFCRNMTQTFYVCFNDSF